MSASPSFPGLPSAWTEHHESIRQGEVFIRILHRNNPLRKRALFVVHGFAEHGGRYLHWPHYLETSVDAVVLIDLPGHGKSLGKRAWISDFSDYQKAAVEACRFSTDWFEKKWGGLEWHWLGHSMGGLITLDAFSETEGLPVRSVTTSAPLLGFGLPVPALKTAAAKWIEPLLGGIRLKNELDTSLLTRDPEVGKTYDEDPLTYSFITPRLFVQMITAMTKNRSRELLFQYPLMMIVPLADKVVSWRESMLFFEKIKTRPNQVKKFCSLPGTCHESFNDIEKSLVFNCLENWILQNSKII